MGDVFESEHLFLEPLHLERGQSGQIQRRLRPRLRPTNDSWRVDETYIRVKGKWVYLYRAVDSTGATIDFLLSARRDTPAAKRFLAKALRGKNHPHPDSDRPSDNDTFPDTVAVSDADALSNGYSHACSESLRQRQSQLDSSAHSALRPSPPPPPPGQSHAVTHLIITPGRLDFILLSGFCVSGTPSHNSWLVKISPF